MATRRIAVTGSAEYLPLGAGGTLAVDHWDALAAQIRGELTPAHADLLAEPQRNPVRGEIDWYADAAAPAIPAAELPEEERRAVIERWHQLRDEIIGLSERIATRRDPASRFMAALLRTALTLPEPEDRNVYSIAGKPVLVAWGHERAGAAATAEILTGRMAVADTPMVILPPPPSPGMVTARQWPFVATLLGSLLLLCLVLLMLWRDPFHWLAAPEVACVADPTQLAGLGTLNDLQTQEGDLRRRLAQIIDDVAARRAMCPPVPAPNADVERATLKGGQGGELQIVLAWNNESDLDLHVICPNGEHLYFKPPRTACGGELDVDANGPGSEVTNTPVENARWERAMPGTYRVEVHNFKPRGTDQVPFRITIRQQGKPDRIISGIAQASPTPQPVTTVEVTE